MGQAIGRAASNANNAANSAAGAAGKGKDSALHKGAKRDPELYVCLSWIRAALQGLSADDTARSFSPS